MYKRQSLDLSHFDTSKVTEMTNMFHECRSLTSLDVSGWNTSKMCIRDRTSSVSTLDEANVAFMLLPQQLEKSEKATLASSRVDTLLVNTEAVLQVVS